ncbi:porin [Oceanisphaera sp. W20_SRM_FM3]|uniref:porin n=1 Tax=Oceanisphaera sp. W20_SRM_FM3 TaxID=3240267 RepID=UPI003F9CD951
MKVFTICALLITSPAMALTFSSADQNDTLAVNAKFKYQLGALGYQWAEPDKAQAVGGADQLSLGLAGSSKLNEAVTLIGEMSWDVLTHADTSQLYADQVWLGARFYDRLDLTVGRSESPFTQVTDLTDVFNIFGGQGYRYQDLILDDQVKTSYYYNNLDVRVAYAMSDHDAQTNNYNTKAQAGISVGYRANNGLGMVIALDNKASHDKKSDVNSVAVGVSYINNNGFYAAVTHNRNYYQAAWDVREFSAWESVASYSFKKFALGLGYNRLSLQKPATETWTSEVILAGEYYLIPQAKLYAEVLLNQIENKDPLYGVGMQYTF